MKKILITTAVLAAITNPAGAYLSFTGLSITENFDALGAGASVGATWQNNSTLPGWYAYQSNINTGSFWLDSSDDSWQLIANYARSIGQGTSSGRLLNLGNSTTSTNRALGSYSQDRDFAYAMVLRNDSATAFDSFTLSYYGEQWQVNAHSFDASMKLDFSYGVFSAFNSGSSNPNTVVPNRAQNPSEFYNGYTNPQNGALDFTALQFGTSTLPLDGDASSNRMLLSSTQQLDWQPGEYLVLRWFDDYYFGKIQAMLAIDDLQFSATPVPEPQTVTLLVVAGLMALGGIWMRRRRNPKQGIQSPDSKP
jgi:hypothetical protein